MNRRAVAMLVVLTISVWTVPGTGAGHCSGTVVVLDDLYPTFYIHYEADGYDTYASVYREANGIPGLQQGGGSILRDMNLTTGGPLVPDYIEVMFNSPCAHPRPDIRIV